MDFEPVVERCADGEEHFARPVKGDSEDESDIEEIEAEPRPRNATKNARSNLGETFWGREQPGVLEAGQDVFLCPLCSQHAPLHQVVPMPSCPCLFCKSCVQDYVGHELGSLRAEPGEDGWKISCPAQACRGQLTAVDCQLIAPEAFARWCEAASETLLEDDDAFIHCPNPQCGIPIEKLGHAPLPFGLELTGVPELDRTVPFLERSPSGTPLSRQALVHRAKFLYRCGKCCTDFCGGCLTAPYHLGISCKENITRQHARRCRFCDSLCGEALDTLDTLLARPVKMLRRETEQEKVDTSWCIEKAELVEVLLWAASVCPDHACRQRLERSCTRMLSCGHHCGGVRGERECLPCLENPCRKPHGRPHPAGALPRADDDCSICFIDALRQGPAIRLECAHVVHFHCAEKKIAAGYPGPAISFGFLSCPLCSERMRHPSLSKALAPALALEAQVRERGRARFRLTLDHWQRRRAAADKGADAKEEAAALAQYQFYLCSRCKAPYFGGERRCAPAGEGPAENAYWAEELVCGACLAGSKGLCKRGHGRDFIEYKCRFCCNVATFFCFGHTHFCDDCHSARPDRNPALVKPCPGATRCKLGVEHPRQGEEFCLGCAACRSTGQ